MRSVVTMIERESAESRVEYTQYIGSADEDRGWRRTGVARALAGVRACGGVFVASVTAR